MNISDVEKEIKFFSEILERRNSNMSDPHYRAYLSILNAFIELKRCLENLQSL